MVQFLKVPINGNKKNFENKNSWPVDMNLATKFI